MGNARRILASATFVATLAAADSGTGTTTRYWDCCKPSCAWNNLDSLGIKSSVITCDKNDKPLTDNTAQSGCTGGTAFMCSNQSPWAVSDTLAYGFAAVSAAKSACCQCYKLTFTSGAVKGKTMVVQSTNTGSDVGSTQFDLAVCPDLASIATTWNRVAHLISRCPEVDSVSITAAPPNGVPLPASGALSTVAHLRIPAASSRRR